MKKILFVISTLNAGGAEKSLVNLLNLIDPEKYAIDLLLLKKSGTFLEQVPASVNIIDQPPTLKYLYHKPSGLQDGLIAYFGYLVRCVGTAISRIVKRKNDGSRAQFRWKYFYEPFLKPGLGKYDIAVSYVEGESNYYVAKFVDAEYKIGWIHNDYTALGFDAEIDSTYFPYFDRLVTISDRCLKILQETFPAFADKCCCLPNLTSAALLQNLAQAYVPSEYENTEGKAILLSIGRLQPQKGYDLAVEAAKLLKAQNKDFVWFVIGAGFLEDTLRKAAAEAGVTDQIHFLGIRSNPYPYIKGADMIVQPSRFEGKSVVLDEAKILCKPIVVTNYSTVKDQIEADTEGVIVPIDAQGIADGIARLIDDPSICHRLTEYLASSDYGNEKDISLYYDVFEEAYEDSKDPVCSF